jgi:hypothetical protein
MPEVEAAFYSPANSQSAMVRFPPTRDSPLPTRCGLCPIERRSNYAFC